MAQITTNLLDLVESQQLAFDDATSPVDRKTRGHFGTPRKIAEFMSSLFVRIPANGFRLLDAGAGVGTLSAAVCARVQTQRQPCHVEAELWENDQRLLPHLKTSMDACVEALAESGHSMTYKIRDEDFVLANTQKTLFDKGPLPRFDFAILNPPYFKLRKDSPQANAMKHIVHGQPNIYACFMAVAVDQLVEGGELVAITPRSYFNGPYFRRFRKWFFDRMTARHIHVFDSRNEAFQKDSVLQENVILAATRGSNSHPTIAISNSASCALSDVKKRQVTYDSVIDNRNDACLIRVVTNPLDQQILQSLDRLPDRLDTLGLAVSTGPVVTFRASEFLREERGHDTAPLLWMHNVRPFVTRLPPRNGKPAHIEVSESSRKLLVPASRYVLLKRFTSKEEKKRLVAGIIQADDSYAEWIGLENHLNYLYRTDGDLTEIEALGIAAYLNTTLADRYFRAISGNTQVNAGELRILPMPNYDTLTAIGRAVAAIDSNCAVGVEKIVSVSLQLKPKLIDQIVKAVK